MKDYVDDGGGQNKNIKNCICVFLETKVFEGILALILVAAELIPNTLEE